MKPTETQIRAHIADLVAVIDSYCNCAATGHEIECTQGRDIATGSLIALRWVLGDDPKYQKLVNTLARELQTSTTSPN